MVRRVGHAISLASEYQSDDDLRWNDCSAYW
jgi:hypothetical protein